MFSHPVTKMRLQLTLLCSFLSGIVLVAMSLFSFVFIKQQYLSQRESHLLQQSSNLFAQIASTNLIAKNTLTELEQKNNLLVFLWENNTPIFWKGSLSTATPRTQLLETALQTLQSSNTSFPANNTERSPHSFFISGSQGEPYRCLASVSSDSSLSLLFIQSAAEETAYLLYVGILFFAVTLAFCFLLIAFCWLFSAKAVKPVLLAEQKQTEFIAAASHELRTPLAVIQASCCAAQIEPEKQSQHLSAIQNESRRMAKLVDELLFLCRCNFSKQPPVFALLESDTLLIDIFDLFSPLAAQNGFSLAIHLPDSALPPVMGDRDRLIQLFSVLLDNAFCYSPPHTTVTLTGEQQGKTVLLSVSDCGCGVPEHLQTKIFDRFYRTQQSRTEKQHFGLGLSVASEIAQLHKATLSVKNNPNGGACFTLCLPIAK